jgi:hypothetical protein
MTDGEKMDLSHRRAAGRQLENPLKAAGDSGGRKYPVVY